jgi:hypothetical protein
MASSAERNRCCLWKSYECAARQLVTLKKPAAHTDLAELAKPLGAHTRYISPVGRTIVLASVHIAHVSESGFCSLLTGLCFHAATWEAVISITAQVNQWCWAIQRVLRNNYVV